MTDTEEIDIEKALFLARCDVCGKNCPLSSPGCGAGVRLADELVFELTGEKPERSERGSEGHRWRSGHGHGGHGHSGHEHRHHHGHHHHDHSDHHDHDDDKHDDKKHDPEHHGEHGHHHHHGHRHGHHSGHYHGHHE